MVVERVTPRPQRHEMGRGLRSQSQGSTEPQRGRPFPRPGVPRFTSKCARVTPVLGPGDLAQGPCKGDCPQLKADKPKSRTTPPSPGPSANKVSTRRMCWCRSTWCSDVRTRCNDIKGCRVGHPDVSDTPGTVKAVRTRSDQTKGLRLRKAQRGRGACALVYRAMGGVWTPSLWQPEVFLSLGLPDASSKRGLVGRLRSHVPTAAAGASPGFHLGDAEPGRELRQQQEPAAALVLEGEAGSGPRKSGRG